MQEQNTDNQTPANEPQIVYDEPQTGEQTGPATPAPGSLALVPQLPQELAAYAGKIELDPDGKMGLAIIAESENDFPIEAFKSLCGLLNKNEIATPWRIADALNSAEVLYGNKASQFQDAATFTGYKATSLTQICFTAANVLPANRREDLSIWFHREVSKLKPHEQKKLLKEAAKCPKEWAEPLGCKAGDPMTIAQLKERVKIFKKQADPPASGEGVEGEGEGEGAGSAAATSDYAPKDEGGKPFIWRFRARENREPLQDYINAERKAHAIAFQMHYDPAFKAEQEAAALRTAEQEKRKAERKKLETAVGALPESERKGFLTLFDSGSDFKTVKDSITARKTAIKNTAAPAATATAGRGKGSKKGGSKKGGSKKTEVAKPGEQTEAPNAQFRGATGGSKSGGKKTAETSGETANP